ncbi:alpha-tocopherol transfer protein-like isoform X2 [Zootermopsis nevadensis]|uniref:Alpha-tocopherol transfer protein-like n=1 Tax=Zootermopsis nevadensis TaxID=136037 RepID=A0A067QHN0_ZOONE|nr:alpha-tocopherol transfer protein-like isoform X2 [Zootermopsis nevadensis]KDR08116.1 Alpha-tocopherol transfer protein-like [Zootermopsis nevadensis]
MPPITAAEEFSKNINMKQEHIEYLRNWMSKQPHLPSEVTDEQLILFLHSCQNHLEACKRTIQAYYKIRSNSPEIFGNRDPNGHDVQQVLSILEFAVLPKKDQHGNAVMAVRFSDLDVTKFSHSGALKTYFMVQDVFMLENGTVPGYVFLMDPKGCRFEHLSRLTLSYTKMYAEYIQDAFPGNVVANHFLNANYVTKAMMAMLKPFLKSCMSRKIFIHTSMNTLYDHVSKDALPKEYGGKLDSLTTYHKMMVAQLGHYRNWFQEEETFLMDESKRPEKQKDERRVLDNEHSTKMLEID